MHALHKQDQYTILTTNGRLATRDRLTTLRAAGLSAVQVPILAASPEVHDDLARRRSWRAAVLTVALALELGLHVIVIFVTTASNVRELPAVLNMVSALGVRNVVMSELQPVGSAIGNEEQLTLAATDFLTAAAEAGALARSMGISLRVVRHAANLERKLDFNGGPWSRWTLTSAAELKLCNFSSMTLGTPLGMPEQQLDNLVNDLQRGDMTAHSGSVDNCACLRASTG